jgi:hypothetical protein
MHASCHAMPCHAMLHSSMYSIISAGSPHVGAHVYLGEATVDNCVACDACMASVARKRHVLRL